MITFITLTCNDFEAYKKTISSFVTVFSDSAKVKHLTYNAGICSLTEDYWACNFLINPQFNYINNRDQGIYDGMNVAMNSISLGEYCCFLNSGDLVQIRSRERLQDLFFSDNNLLESIIGRAESFHVPIYTMNLIRLKPKNNLTTGIPICHQAFFHKVNSKLHFDTSYVISSDYNFFLRHVHLFGYPKYLDLAFQICYDLSGVSQRRKIKRETENFHILYTYFGFLACFKYFISLLGRVFFAIFSKYLSKL